MPDTKDFDLDYRPRTYWVYGDPLGRVAATVKGEVRRRVAALALAGDPAGFTDPECFEESLADAERQARGRLHPALMGGEYLPDRERGEVEIARVRLASITGDVTSIRARWAGGRIRYRVVDEYWDERGEFTVAPAAADRPLSLGELIALIDTARDPASGPGEPAGLVLRPLWMNHEYGGVPRRDLLDFVAVGSPFYPELAAWYDEVVAEWCAADPERGGAGDADDDEGVGRHPRPRRGP